MANNNFKSGVDELVKEAMQQPEKDVFADFKANAPKRREGLTAPLGTYKENLDYIEKNITDPDRKAKYLNILKNEDSRNKIWNYNDFYGTYEAMANDDLDDLMKAEKEYYKDNKEFFDNSIADLIKSGKNRKEIYDYLHKNDLAKYVEGDNEYYNRLQGNLNKGLTRKEFQKLLDQLEEGDEIANGNMVVEKLYGYSPSRFRTRFIGDQDDIMTDYFAGSWNNNRKRVLDKLYGDKENK